MTTLLRLALAALMLAAPGVTWSQDLKVTMSFSERMFLGQTLSAGPAVICTGYPTCRSELVVPAPGCGTVSSVVTGLNLAQSGGVGGTRHYRRP